MQSPANARQTLLTSDYDIDKVVFKYSATKNVATAATMSDSKLYTIPHGLPFRPLCIGSYSDDNFATSYDFGNCPVAYIPMVGQWGQRIASVVSSDATNIYIDAINFDTTRDFQFRVVCLLPPDAPNDSSVTKPPTVGGTLFSSDADYMKTLTEGSFTIVDSGAFGFESRTVTHNLGYVPCALVFTEWGGRTRMVGSENFIGVGGIESNAQLNNSDLIINFDPYYAGTLKLHYKVYING